MGFLPRPMGWAMFLRTFSLEAVFVSCCGGSGLERLLVFLTFPCPLFLPLLVFFFEAMRVAFSWLRASAIDTAGG